MTRFENGSYTEEELDNGDLVLTDPNGTIVRRWSVADEQWVYPAVSTGSGTVGGDTMIGFPSNSSPITYAFGDGWVTADSNRPVWLLVETTAETDGTSNAIVTVDVDESGGSSSNFIVATARADANMAAGTVVRETSLVPLVEGATYRVNNRNDPNGNNGIQNIRKFTL